MLSYLIVGLLFLSLFQNVKFYLIRRKLKNGNKTPIINGAEPFYLQGKNKKGILLIHGFTASPQELKELGQYLNEKGFTVSCPLLKGHGTSPENLFNYKYQDWLNQLKKELNQLTHICDEVHIIGNSFGGNLAVLIANSSNKVKSVSLLASPFTSRFDKFMRLGAYIFKNVKLFKKKNLSKKVKKVYKKSRRVCYEQVPLFSILEVGRVIKMSRKILPKIKKPVLLIQAENDNIIPHHNIDYLLSRLNNLKIFLVPKSIHVFLADNNKEIAFEEIYKFVNV
jgi:carboxylesterase